jgi:hypothetical protein
MRVRGDSAIALAFIAVGFAPALIKKSKTLSRYLGDQLIRAGEYLHHDSQEVVPPPHVEEVTPTEASSEAHDVVAEAPVVETEVVEAEVVVEEPSAEVGEVPKGKGKTKS